jgi:hypothetical protein
MHLRRRCHQHSRGSEVSSVLQRQHRLKRAPGTSMNIAIRWPLGNRPSRPKGHVLFGRPASICGSPRVLAVAQPLVVPLTPLTTSWWQSTSRSRSILVSVLGACANIVAFNLGASGAMGISPSDAASGEIPALSNAKTGLPVLSLARNSAGTSDSLLSRGECRLPL